MHVQQEAYWPNNRGFDSFYGFLGGYEDYLNKTYEGYLDLRANNDLVLDPKDTDNELYSAMLFQQKAQDMIAQHANISPNKPMFLYYPMQLIHYPWMAPDTYKDRCALPTIEDDYVDSDMQSYCAMNVILDEALTNLTCTLNTYGYNDNTLIVVISDNGGEKTFAGNSYPYKGHKGALYRGGISGTAIFHGNMIPTSSKGQKYLGNPYF